MGPHYAPDPHPDPLPKTGDGEGASPQAGEGKIYSGTFTPAARKIFVASQRGLTWYCPAATSRRSASTREGALTAATGARAGTVE